LDLKLDLNKPGTLEEEGEPVPVRWRRWVRRRRRKHFEDESSGVVRELTGSALHPHFAHQYKDVGIVGGQLSEEHIVCEGWLFRRKGNAWTTEWSILVRSGTGKVCLLFCPSREDANLKGMYRPSKKTPFLTNKEPPMSSYLFRSMKEFDRKSCFGLGSARAGEGMLLRTTSPSDTRLKSGVFGKAGALRIKILTGQNLRVVDTKDGRKPPDTFAHLAVQHGDRVFHKSTHVVKHSFEPRWDRKFMVQDVFDEFTEVRVTVYHARGLLGDRPIGTTKFKLRDMSVPNTGRDAYLRNLELLPPNQLDADAVPMGNVTLKMNWLKGNEADADEALNYDRDDEELIDFLTQSNELHDYHDPEVDAEEAEKEAAREVGGPSSKSGITTEDSLSAGTSEPKRGDYQLRVHVIEARGLVGRDAGGTCDPQVTIKWNGREMSSSQKNKQNSPVWDENVFVVAKDMQPEVLKRSQIEIRVMDIDLLSSNDLVGLYSLDAAFLYYQPNHELYRQWLVLSAPYEAREGGLFDEDSRGGAQGYLLLSLTLLGPGDKPAVHPEDDQEADKQAIHSAILMPPQIKRELVFVRVGVHRAYGLPDMNGPALFGRREEGGNLESYVRVQFAGNAPKTRRIKSNSAAWNTEFWIPVWLPSVGQQITFYVCDHEWIGEVCPHLQSGFPKALASLRSAPPCPRIDKPTP
jgi:hypothetical protein